MKHPQTLITLKPHYSLQGDGVSIAIAQYPFGHLHTFNSDCRIINDYQTFNTTYTLDKDIAKQVTSYSTVKQLINLISNNYKYNFKHFQYYLAGKL